MQYVDNIREVISFKGKDLLFCYGVGVVGRDFCDLCEKHDIEVEGYVISDGQNNNVDVKKPVFFLSTFLCQFPNQKIIVTTDKKYHNEIHNNLLKSGVSENNMVFLRDIINFIRRVFVEDVEYRKSLSIFDYKKVAMPLHFVTRRHTDINFYYGNERLIKKALDISTEDDLNAEIEHSPRGIDNLIIHYEVDKENKFGDTIYVSSNERKKFLQKHLPSKKIVSVGLYIKYAERIISDIEFSKIKKELGKVLLVFPYHSTGGFSCKFEPVILLSEIQKYESDFDNILVCMYWHDVVEQNEEIFKKNGYKIVTAGNIYDYYFTSRLRTIIELSDMTMSNAIGTHIAYCTCLNKPHYLVREKLCGKLSEGETVDDSLDYLKKIEHLSLVPVDAGRSRRIRELIYEAFGRYKTDISKTQKELVRKYYGEW